MSHHRCNCCGTLACQQPGPCCEPPPEGNIGYGRCTPRGFTKQPDGSWTGSAPTSVHGVVSATGRFEFFKVVRNFDNPAGYTARRTLNFNFSNADPRAGFVMTSTDTGVPCRLYTGGNDWAIPPTIAGEGEPLDPQMEFADIACTTPDINPIVTVNRLLRSTFKFTPKGDIPSDFDWGVGGSDGALGIYQITIEMYECRVTLAIGVGRPAGRPPGYYAVALSSALIALGNLGGVPTTATIRAPEVLAVALTPCGTKVRATINKPIGASPLGDFGGDVDALCPMPGTIDPSTCRICRAVGIEMEVVVDLNDLFTACAKCDLVVESPCCSGSGMYVPSPAPTEGGVPRWVDTPIQAGWSREVVSHPDGHEQRLVEEGSFDGVLVWQPGCPLACIEFNVRWHLTFSGGETHGSFTNRVCVHMFGPGAGGPDGRPYLRVSFGEFAIGLGAGFDAHLLRDIGDSSIVAPPPGDGVTYITNRTVSRWGSINRVREVATHGSGAVNGDTYSHDFFVALGPLFSCVLPSPGGGGGGDSLVMAGGGGGGGGGCGDCGGGFA